MKGPMARPLWMTAGMAAIMRRMWPRTPIATPIDAVLQAARKIRSRASDSQRRPAHLKRPHLVSERMAPAMGIV